MENCLHGIPTDQCSKCLTKLVEERKKTVAEQYKAIVEEAGILGLFQKVNVHQLFREFFPNAGKKHTEE
jgi:hypothetical protein